VPAIAGQYGDRDLFHRTARLGETPRPRRKARPRSEHSPEPTHPSNAAGAAVSQPLPPPWRKPVSTLLRSLAAAGVHGGDAHGPSSPKRRRPCAWMLAFASMTGRRWLDIPPPPWRKPVSTLLLPLRKPGPTLLRHPGEGRGPHSSVTPEEAGVHGGDAHGPSSPKRRRPCSWMLAFASMTGEGGSTLRRPLAEAGGHASSSSSPKAGAHTLGSPGRRPGSTRLRHRGSAAVGGGLALSPARSWAG